MSGTCPASEHSTSFVAALLVKSGRLKIVETQKEAILSDLRSESQDGSGAAILRHENPILTLLEINIEKEEKSPCIGSSCIPTSRILFSNYPKRKSNSGYCGNSCSVAHYAPAGK